MSSTRKRKPEPEENLRYEEKRSAEGKEKALESIASLFAVCQFLVKTFKYYEESYKKGVQLGMDELEQFVNEKSRIRFVTGESRTVQNFINDMCGPEITTKQISNFKSLLGKKLMKIGLHLVHSDIDEIRTVALRITETASESHVRCEKLKTKYDSFLVISGYLHHRINEKLSTPVRLEHSLLLKEWMGHGTMLEQSKEQTEIEVKNFFKNFERSATKQSSKDQGSNQQEADESDENVPTDDSDSDYEPYASARRQKPGSSRSHRSRVNAKPMPYVPTTAEDLPKVSTTNDEKNSVMDWEMPSLEANVIQELLDPVCETDLPPPLSPIQKVGFLSGVELADFMPSDTLGNVWATGSPSMIPAKHHSENRHLTIDFGYENENFSEKGSNTDFLEIACSKLPETDLVASDPERKERNSITSRGLLLSNPSNDGSHGRASVLVSPENDDEQRIEKETNSAPLDGDSDHDVPKMGETSSVSDSTISSRAPTESEFLSKNDSLEGISETASLDSNTSGECSSIHDRHDEHDGNRLPSAFTPCQINPDRLTAFTRFDNASSFLRPQNTSTIEMVHMSPLAAPLSTSGNPNSGSTEQSTHFQGNFNLDGVLPQVGRDQSHISLNDLTEYDSPNQGLPYSQSSSTSGASLFGQPSTSHELYGFVPNNIIGLDSSHQPFQTMVRTDHQNFGNFALVAAAFDSQISNQLLPSYPYLPNYNVLAAPNRSSATFHELQSGLNEFQFANHLHRGIMAPPSFEQSLHIPEQMLQHRPLNVDLPPPPNLINDFPELYAVLPDNLRALLYQKEAPTADQIQQMIDYLNNSETRKE